MADDGIEITNVPPGGALARFLGLEMIGSTLSLRQFTRSQVMGFLDAAVASFQAGGGIVFGSRAEANAHLAYNAYQMAWVVGDATPGFNGVYQKGGASGAGGWNWIAPLPYSYFRALNAGAGSANAIEASNDNPIASEDALVVFNITTDNTAQPTYVRFNGGAWLRIMTAAGNDPSVGGLKAGMLVAGYIFGTQFRMLSDQASSAIQAAAEAAAAVARGYGGTSTTSLAISTGVKTFTTQQNLAYRAGGRGRLIYPTDPTKYQEGPITAYDPGTGVMTINVDFVGPGASGTYANWGLTITGEKGAGDLRASLNLSDLEDKVAARTTLYAAPLDMQDDADFYNGTFWSDCRNEGDYYQVSQYPAAELYTVEQARAQVGAGCVAGIRRDVGIANQGFANALQFLCITAKPTMPVGELDHIEFTLEGCDIGKYRWGTADAKPMTLQFWANSSYSGLRSVMVMPGNNTCSCVKSFATVAGAWTYHEVTFPALTAAILSSVGGGVAIPTAAGSIGIKVLFDLGAGSNFITATPDAWGGGVSSVYPGAATPPTRISGSTFGLTGIQADVGSKALPFRHIPRHILKRKVERYIYKSLPEGVRWYDAGGSGNWAPHSYVSQTDALVSGGGVDIRWPTEMVRPPTVLARNPVSANNKWRNFSASADSGVASIIFPYQRGVMISNPGVAGDARGSLMQINVLANANLGGD